MFFITFIILTSFMLLNLFVAIILDKFVDSAQAEGLLSTASFFDALQRKMLLDGSWRMKCAWTNTASGWV